MPSKPIDHIILNGKQLKLIKHPTDFSVVAPETRIAAGLKTSAGRIERLSGSMTRMSAKNATTRDSLMENVRRENVAHHVYQIADTDEEIVIDDRIVLEMQHEDPEALDAIMREFKLESQGRMGNAHVLRVTEATGMNPLKTANAISEREGVSACAPQVLVPMVRHQTSLVDTYRFFRRQWYMTADLLAHADLEPTAGIQAPEAWEITRGSPDIVIAVIDDGFDLDHPAFRNKRIHPAARDYAEWVQDDDPRPGLRDYHGTCVASIATGSGESDGMIGVAPGCTLLPIRIGFGGFAPPVDILDVFKYASQHADVVNCSFGLPPSQFDRLGFNAGFRDEITQLTINGGRRGRGLVIVFSAGNDDAPTRLHGPQNLNGVKYVDARGGIAEIPAGSEVYSGHPLTRGVVVAGAMSSLKRKAGYSCWGPHVTVTAPSNNMHYITRFIRPGVNDAVRGQFVANYRGLGQVAAVNRPLHGQPFDPFADDPGTPEFREDFYTGEFGGTSGAAPIVTGVAALMLSVNPTLTAEEVRQILMATADKDLDSILDLANDPNVQGLSGEFVNGKSLFFGAGKVNALRAVQRAKALLDGRAPSPAIARRRARQMRLEAAEQPLRALRVETLAWSGGRFVGGVGHWKIAGPHNGEATHGDARLFVIDAQGRLLREYVVDTSVPEGGDPQAGAFIIRVGRFAPQVGHPPCFTELVVNDPSQVSARVQFLILVSTRPAAVPVSTDLQPLDRLERGDLASAAMSSQTLVPDAMHTASTTKKLV